MFCFNQKRFQSYWRHPSSHRPLEAPSQRRYVQPLPLGAPHEDSRTRWGNGGANRCHSQLSQHCNLFENVGTVLVTRRCELIFRFCSEWESNLILLCWPSRGSEIHSCNSLKQTLLCPATTSKAVESCFSPPLLLPMDMTSAPCI